MDRLLEIMRRLRAPDGCPWDREQSHQSLRPYLLEEAAEAVDAIPSDPNASLAELPGELGDVLLQVAFHSVIAEEHQAFNYSDVEASIVEKLIRRHPHVFGSTTVGSSDEVVSNWQEIKRRERADQPEPHPAARVPSGLGALARAHEVAKALGQAKGRRENVQALLEQAQNDEESVADVLEAVVAWARSCNLNAEVALRQRLQARIAQAQ